MTDENTGAFGELLRRLRVAAGLTQEALAEQSKLSTAAISALERGTRQAPYRETVRLLADALGLGSADRAALMAAASRPRTHANTAPRASAPTPPGHTLPVPLTSFVGRERDLTSLGQLLGEGRRLLTLTGSGGVGKTRLVAEVARAAERQFQDGIWYVDLTPLSTPALVPQAVAAVLDVREVSGRPFTPAIADWLARRTALLVLDNCEHVLAACAELVATLLRECPRTTVAATSRERLGIRGEQVYQVPPLPLPPADWPSAGANAGAALLEFAAIRLFVDRAQAARREFAFAAENAGAVAEICRRLDGLPLAIELAAAWVRVLSPEQIAARLQQRFLLLAGASRQTPPRHQTLRSLVDWSYDLLSDAERAVLRRLAVFVGGWTLEAAEVICGGEEIAPWQVLDPLSALVDKSLVVADTGGEVARYSLLESIREYAAEKLETADETELTRHRHADHYRDLAERAQPELRGPDQVAWLGRLEEEHNNLRAALNLAAADGNAEIGLRLATALAPFWEGRGHLEEGRRWIELLLAMPTAGAVPAALRAKALLAGGRLAQWQTHLDEAATLLEASLDMARSLADRAIEAEALVYLGAVRRRQGGFERSAALVEQSLALYRAAENDAGIALALLTLGVTVRFQGDAARSVTLLEESLSRFRRLGDGRWTAITQTMLGGSVLHQGDPGRAAGFIRAGLAGHHTVGDRAFMVFGLMDMAAVLVAQAQPARAAQILGAMQALREALGAPLAPANVREYEYVVRAVRRTLSDVAFAAAVAQGEALPLDAAVALALEEAPLDAPVSCGP